MKTNLACLSRVIDHAAVAGESRNRMKLALELMASQAGLCQGGWPVLRQSATRWVRGEFSIIGGYRGSPVGGF